MDSENDDRINLSLLGQNRFKDVFHTILPLTPQSIGEITKFVNECTLVSLFDNSVVVFDEAYIQYLFVLGCVPIMFYTISNGHQIPVGFIAGRKVTINHLTLNHHSSTEIQTSISALNIHLLCTNLPRQSFYFNYMTSILIKECRNLFLNAFVCTHIATNALMPNVNDESYCKKRLLVRPINNVHNMKSLLQKSKYFGIVNNEILLQKIWGTFSYPTWYNKCLKIRHITPDLIDEILTDHVHQCIMKHSEQYYQLYERLSTYSVGKMLHSKCFKNFLIYDQSIDETMFINFYETTLVGNNGSKLRVGHLYHATFKNQSFSYVDGIMEWVCKWIKEWDLFDIVSMEELYNINFSRMSKFVLCGSNTVVYDFQNLTIPGIPPFRNGMKSV